jgi:hypothetical protein
MQDKVIDLDEAKAMMSTTYRDRFADLWHKLTHPDKYGAIPTNSVPLGRILTKHTDQLCQHDVIQPVSEAVLSERPTKGASFAFVGVEERESGRRLRFLLWPKHVNEALDAHYTASMPLEHTGRYLDRVTEETAVTGDLLAAFYQVQLPLRARAWYRFRDASGRLFEMKRLPMGHKIAPEIMQLIAEVIAGCPHAVASSAYANPRGSTTSAVLGVETK